MPLENYEIQISVSKNKVFIGTQPNSFIYMLSIAASVLQWQSNSCDRDYMSQKA